MSMIIKYHAQYRAERHVPLTRHRLKRILSAKLIRGKGQLWASEQDAQDDIWT